MNNKSKPLEILLIDDDKEYHETLQDYLRDFKIKVNPFTNLEDGQEFMKLSSQKIVGVVLDVKCLKSKAQEVPENDFFMIAYQYFEQNYSHIPKAILTGETGIKESLKLICKGTIEVFSKASEEEKLGQFLLTKGKSLDYIQIRKESIELCELVEFGILDNSALTRYTDIFKNMNQNDQGMIEDNLSKIRLLQEAIYKGINKIDANLVETRNIENGVKCNEINRNFVDKDIMVKNKDILNHFVWSIYNISSNFGSHDLSFTPLTKPTKNTVKSLFYALNDLIRWCHELFKNHR